MQKKKRFNYWTNRTYLKKNKIVIPKEFKTNFFKENVSKPISKLKSSIANYKEEKIKDKNRLIRRVENYKHDTTRKINHSVNNLWKGIGVAGLNFLNVIPTLGSTLAKFFSNLFTDVFNSIYNQQIDQKSARNVIIGFFVVAGVTTAIVAGVKAYKDYDFFESKVETKKPSAPIKKEVKKPEIDVKKEVKKPEAKIKKETKKPELKVKKK